MAEILFDPRDPQWSMQSTEILTSTPNTRKSPRSTTLCLSVRKTDAAYLETQRFLTLDHQQWDTV